mgnify:CR=1 FL=1
MLHTLWGIMAILAVDDAKCRDAHPSSASFIGHLDTPCSQGNDPPTYGGGANFFLLLALYSSL